jgi:Na+-driven multidrug efflux pump
LLNSDPKVLPTAIQTLRIISAGYVLYGVSMVMMNALNGSGDTKTPTWINFVCFWLFQIPLAYVLSDTLHMGPKGVFIAIVSAESLLAIVAVIIFRRGKWKEVKI